MAVYYEATVLVLVIYRTDYICEVQVDIDRGEGRGRMKTMRVVRDDDAR